MSQWWLLGLAGLVLLILAAAIIWLRKRQGGESEGWSFEEEAGKKPAPSPGPPARLAPTAAKTSGEALPPAEPPPSEWCDLLEVRFVPGRIRISPVYVALTYRLEIANGSERPIGALRISAGMISAHASRPTSEQLALERDRAENLHRTDVLEKGGSAAFTGELRLPLSEVRQIPSGPRVIFVPLVRFLIEREGVEGECRRAYTLGQPPQRAGDRMMPLRFDLGPRLIWRLDSREVDMPRWLPANDVRKAG